MWRTCQLCCRAERRRTCEINPCWTETTLSIIAQVSESDPAEELRRLYSPLLTTAHVAEMMHCTIGDVRDKVHRKELPALRWGNQFRFFRDEVISVLERVEDDHHQPKHEQR